MTPLKLRMNTADRSGRGALTALFVLASLAAATPARGQTDAREPSMCGPSPPAVEATPAFTPAEICATIAVLAADSMEGREAGTQGAFRAAEYIAARFRMIGLETRNQGFPFSRSKPHPPQLHPHHNAPADTLPLPATNIVAILPGADPELRDEAVVVGAHYDHLGWGGIGSLAPDEHAIHNGADDNASGVAGLLELAHHFSVRPPRRTLVFLAFGAEELGALGSQHYVRKPVWPIEQTVAMVNLDMIGRLRDRLTVQGVGSSPAWPAILDSLAKRPGAPELARIPDGLGPSDHSSFYIVNVPVLFFFTGAHDDYHRPGDDVERIDGAGEARVLELVAEAIASTADADERIAFSEAPVTERRAAAFKVGLGVVPDYGFAGPGLRLSGVRAGGPADRAGLRADDVLLELAGRSIDDVYGYTAILAQLEANEPVEAVVTRGGETVRLTVTPEPR